MFRCEECGHEFEEPRMIRESHGEYMGHCPNCSSLTYFDLMNYRCRGCYGYKKNMNDRWCSECRNTAKYYIKKAILKAVQKTGLSIASVVDLFIGVINEKDFILNKERIAVNCLMEAVVNIAYDRGCGVYDALDMIEDWVDGEL